MLQSISGAQNVVVDRNWWSCRGATDVKRQRIHYLLVTWSQKVVRQWFTLHFYIPLLTFLTQLNRPAIALGLGCKFWNQYVKIEHYKSKQTELLYKARTVILFAKLVVVDWTISASVVQGRWQPESVQESRVELQMGSYNSWKLKYCIYPSSWRKRNNNETLALPPRRQLPEIRLFRAGQWFYREKKVWCNLNEMYI